MTQIDDKGKGGVMKLPKLYRVVKIKFWSLRTYGNSFDNDVEVTRKARRVLDSEGWWKWQLVECDHYYSSNNVNDDTCLNNALDDMSDIEILF